MIIENYNNYRLFVDNLIIKFLKFFEFDHAKYERITEDCTKYYDMAN